MVILLVRHADAGRRREDDADDRLRPLSALGWEQARAIGDRLSPLGSARIITSPAERCVQTIGPLARILDTTVELSDALIEGQGVAAVALFRSLLQFGSGPVVVCSHGDVITALLTAVTEDHRLDADSPRSGKGSVWTLHTEGERVARASYLAPEPAPPRR